MVKFFRLLDKRLIVFVVALLIASPIVWGKNTYTYCLINSHYLTVYVNPVFLLFVYQYIYRMNQIHNPLILRLSKESYETNSYLSVIFLACVYCLFVYGSYYIFFTVIESQLFVYTFLFMIVNLTMTCLECSLIYLQLGKHKRFLYIALPIFVNFLFHFFWLYYF